MTSVCLEGKYDDYKNIKGVQRKRIHSYDALRYSGFINIDHSNKIASDKSKGKAAGYGLSDGGFYWKGFWV